MVVQCSGEKGGRSNTMLHVDSLQSVSVWKWKPYSWWVFKDSIVHLI
jgi:hypothetical protein